MVLPPTKRQEHPRRDGDPDRAKRELEHLNAQMRHPNVLKYVSCVKHRDHTVEIDMEYADASGAVIVPSALVRSCVQMNLRFTPER